METMTPKERIDAVIKHQAVDRTPFTVVDGGAWIAKTEGVTYRELWVIPSLKKLRQYRTILSAELRRQIFWQFKQKTQRILCVFTRFFVTTAGKYASGAALKATAMNCAVLP